MLDFVLWLLYLGVGSWLILGAAIFAYPTVRRLRDKWDEFGWVVKAPIVVFGILGLTADFIFNVLIGTARFLELPREWLFTARLKRHHYGDNDKQRKRAAKWVWRVNTIDPGHV